LGATNPARINFQHTAFESFVLSGIGILIFIAFGADHKIYRHWYKLIRLTWSRDWEGLKGLVIHGKDPFGSSKGSKSRENSNSGTSDKNSKISFTASVPSFDRVTSTTALNSSNLGRTNSDISGVNEILRTDSNVSSRNSRDMMLMHSGEVNPVELEEIKTVETQAPADKTASQELKKSDVFLL